MTHRTLIIASLMLLISCNGEEALLQPCCDSLPTNGLYATFRVVDEYFHASITNPEGMSEARSLWVGASPNIPNGLLLCTSAPWNPLWSWHLDPSSVRFADATIEVCDGTPSYVEANCSSFGTQYCPWSAEMTDLRDCDLASDCPRVPR